MRILVTGGSGVIGAGALPALLEAGHEIRLLARAAGRDAQDYPERVEAFPANIADASSVQGAAEGCEAVVHIAGIVEERPPDSTFERINVRGTSHLLEEARRAAVRRFVFLSSLGADTGESEYHASKRRAEDLVKSFEGEWLILRPGNVYGPGDEVISMLFKMIRTLPLAPVIGQGDQKFQPIWFEDLGRAIVRAVEDRSLAREILELAGAETTTTTEVLDKICEITGRRPPRVPFPSWLAQIGASLAEWTGGPEAANRSGLAMPLNRAKLQMLLEENVIRRPGGNALASRLGIEPTPLDEGLRQLSDSLPELLPEDGIGKIERKRFWADIQGARISAATMMRLFRDHVAEIMPIEFAAEPGVPHAAQQGATLTGAIPGRGNIQVRIEEDTPESVTFASVEGHPIAGLVTFRCSARDNGLRFTVEVHDRAADIFDWIALRGFGARLQNQNWKALVKRMIELSGGVCPAGVESSHETLSREEIEQVEEKARQLVQRRKREANRSLADAGAARLASD